MEVTTKSAKETQELAKKFAQKLKGGELIFLRGELGSGKTTFTQGLAKGLRIKEKIKSPSFVIIHEYKIANQSQIPIANNRESKLIHVDLYRLDKQAEIETLGLADYFDAKNIIIVEWPEKLKNWPRKPDYIINFQHKGENERQIKIKKQ